MLKCYSTELINGYGRFVALIAAEQIEETKDAKAEIYVFGLDTKAVYDNSSFEYLYREGDKDRVDVNLEFLTTDTLLHAKMLITRFQDTKFKETGNVDHIKQEAAFTDCKPETVITLGNLGYKPQLEQIQKETHIAELRDYLGKTLQVKNSGI